MQIAFNSGRKQKRGSRAARKAVSPKRVRRRRHAQTRRRFTSALRSTHAFVLRNSRSRQGAKESAKRKPSTLPVPAGAQATLFPGFSGLAPSKTISLLLLAAVAAALYWLYTSESFYIYSENVSFEGARYLSQEELFTASDIDSWSIFWLDPDEIAEQVMTHPYVTAADVKIRWPGHINISVQEVRPVALWGDRSAGVLAAGRRRGPRPPRAGHAACPAHHRPLRRSANGKRGRRPPRSINGS